MVFTKVLIGLSLFCMMIVIFILARFGLLAERLGAPMARHVVSLVPLAVWTTLAFVFALWAVYRVYG